MYSEAARRARRLRVGNLVRERAQARETAALLAGLQNDLLRIASLRAPDMAIAQLLRSAVERLGFGRGFYFSVDREHGIRARWQVDGSAEAVPALRGPGVCDDALLVQALRGEAATGLRSYVLRPLTHGATTLGLVFLDRYGPGAMPEDRPQLVEALAKAAALSIGNGLLLDRAHDLASRDGLTGLLNRRALAERLPIELELCRERKTSLTYALVDIDDLKRVNDSSGHLQGDAVLVRVAEALVQSSRAGDVIGRYGGDEFVVMLPLAQNEVARELVARLSGRLRADGLRCSIGAALFPRDGGDERALTLAADRALYAHKAAGKNGYSFA